MRNSIAHDARLERSAQSIAEENARFMSKVYLWMTIGILLSSAVSYVVGNSPDLVYALVENRVLFWGLLIAQLGCVFVLSLAIKKLSAAAATLVYLAYAALTGLTLSAIFLLYTQDSILNAFAVTAFGFAGLSAFGYFTKKDLRPIGAFCTMGLFGLIGFSLLSIFFPSLMGGQARFVYALAGIVIFAGLTAYDTQKIKAMNIIGNEGTDEDHKEAIFGALTLYLDFINLFLKILQLMGRRK